MNHKIILLSLFFYIQIYCQFVEYSQFNWQTLEWGYSEEMKENLISKLTGNEYFDVTYLKDPLELQSIYNEVFPLKEIDRYHILDINGDSLPDIIYEGLHSTGEGDNVTFFINNGDSLKIALKIFGNIETIKFNDNSISKIQFLVKPCCANYITFRDYYSLDFKGKFFNSDYDSLYNCTTIQFLTGFFEVTLDSSEALNYCSTTILDKNVPFITNEEIYLTFDPSEVVNKEEPDEYSAYDVDYIAWGNNQIARLKKGSDGIILSEKTNEQGDKYFFIKTNNINSIQSIFSKKIIIIYGWVKAGDIVYH